MARSTYSPGGPHCLAAATAAVAVFEMVTLPKDPDTWWPSPPGVGGPGAAGVRLPCEQRVYPPPGPPFIHHPSGTHAFPAVALCTPESRPDTWIPPPSLLTGIGGTGALLGRIAGGRPAVPLFAASASPPSAISDDVHEARIKAENARGARVDLSAPLPMPGSSAAYRLHPASTVHVPWSAGAAATAMASALYPRGWTHGRPRKYALLIGMNYRHTLGMKTLHGCMADVRNIRRLLTTRCGYDPADVVTLTDEPVGGHGGARGLTPTRDVILSEMTALVAKSTPGDSIFFHFSGHGGQVQDFNGDEPDCKDEVLVSVDSKFVVDDEVHMRLVKALPPGVRMTALIDACHSATAMDLPHFFNAPWRGGRGCSEGCGTAQGCGGDRVIAFGACRDEQLAADWHGACGGTASAGAATTFFVEAVEHNVGGITYCGVLDHMRRRIVEENMPQVPVLSSSCPLYHDARLVL